MVEEDRNPLQFLGRVLGTSYNCDGTPGMIWDTYNFIPAPNVSLPSCNILTIDEVRGIFITRNNGDSDPVFDIITILKDVPKFI